MWHLFIHAIAFAAHRMDDDRIPVASMPYSSLDYLKSELRHLMEILSTGMAMRNQTPAERCEFVNLRVRSVSAY